MGRRFRIRFTRARTLILLLLRLAAAFLWRSLVLLSTAKVRRMKRLLVTLTVAPALVARTLLKWKTKTTMRKMMMTMKMTITMTTTMMTTMMRKSTSLLDSICWWTSKTWTAPSSTRKSSSPRPWWTLSLTPGSPCFPTTATLSSPPASPASACCSSLTSASTRGPQKESSPSISSLAALRPFCPFFPSSNASLPFRALPSSRARKCPSQVLAGPTCSEDSETTRHMATRTLFPATISE
mmetsp:Transcript_23286/g.30812  ORF Transcript_23286/g.30812 Transcript_23286/m.30812 type:complete len:239 (+) Transcript_23286:333-1049(+)